MTSDPFTFRCRNCRDPLDHLLDDFDSPPDFCPGGQCEAQYLTRRARRRARWSGWFNAFIVVVSRPFVPYRHPFYAQEIPAAMTSLRKNTPPHREDGQLIAVEKRSCNGCGIELGDATPAEAFAIRNGTELPDVRGECLHCSKLVAIAGVGIGDEVLFRLKSADKWIPGTVSGVSQLDGKLRIDLSNGSVAVEVTHGFDYRQWCTLDELVEHRKVTAREVSTDA
jgi:hypothetical protein